MKPRAVDLKVAHSARVKALLAGKKKTDRIDAETLADLLRCNLLPQVRMMPAALRELRRILGYRNLLIRQRTRFQNRMAGLLMQTGVRYNRRKLHGQRYFQQRVDCLRSIPSVGLIVALTWALEIGAIRRFGSISRALSYCGLTSTLRESAGQQKRIPCLDNAASIFRGR